MSKITQRMKELFWLPDADIDTDNVQIYTDQNGMKQAKGFHVRPDPVRLRVEEAKHRQRERALQGIPSNPSNAYIAAMLSDMLENQARIENMLKRILK